MYEMLSCYVLQCRRFSWKSVASQWSCKIFDLQTLEQMLIAVTLQSVKAFRMSPKDQKDPGHVYYTQKMINDLECKKK